MSVQFQRLRFVSFQKRQPRPRQGHAAVTDLFPGHQASVLPASACATMRSSSISFHLPEQGGIHMKGRHGALAVRVTFTRPPPDQLVTVAASSFACISVMRDCMA
jgi:hypothetical protein